MGPLGVPELLFILVLALLIFGPNRLPEIGRTLGRGMSEFRKASNELKRSINTELALDEAPAPPPAVRSRLEPADAEPATAPAASTSAVPAVPAVPAAIAAPTAPPAMTAARNAPLAAPEPLEPPAPPAPIAEPVSGEPLEPR